MQSYRTRLTPGTSLTMRFVTFASTSQELRRFRRHKVAGHDGPQGNGVIIGTAVSHNPYGAHIGEGGEILAQLLVGSCPGHLLPVDVVGILNNLYLLSGNLADDADAQARSREGLTADEMLRDSQGAAHLPDFILKEKSEGLHDFLEVHIVREAAYVVVGFNHRRLAQAAFDYVRVDGSLDEKVNRPDFFASASNTRINSSPIIFRFLSGSVTPASFFRKLSEASTRMKFKS